ncbi:aspartate carbamoyltransferase [Candidatus Microgenomates bacterium]|nr:aspartate carbamoyltransferase [Candidatus Microgenomates bacterium]
MVEQRRQTPEAVHQPPFAHIIEAQQFTHSWLEEQLFPLADQMEAVAQGGGNLSLVGKRLFNLFYEPSTRTRISFESAMQLLGGQVSGTENARAFSSAVKGETLEDTVKILNGYFYDAIVLRYDEEGGAARAAMASDNAPTQKHATIINAGDGSGQHPTQALLDVYTVQRFLGGLDRVSMAIVGDLAYGRTTHSLAYLMSKFEGVKMYFVSPPNLRMKPEILRHLSEQKVKFRELTDLAEVVDEVDAVYMTRPQLERFIPKDRVVDEVDAVYMTRPQLERFIPKDRVNFQSNGAYTMTREILKAMKPNSIVMHPLPRTGEVPAELDDDSRIVCFPQAQLGLYVRMALLRMLLRPDLN